VNLEDLSHGSLSRLKRIQELRKCDEIQALEFAISVGWLAAEKRANGVALNKTLKSKGEQ